MNKDLVQKVLDHFISNSTNSGHADYCNAVKGPTGETWVQDEDCDCGLNALRDSLEKEVSNDTKNNT